MYIPYGGIDRVRFNGYDLNLKSFTSSSTPCYFRLPGTLPGDKGG